MFSQAFDSIHDLRDHFKMIEQLLLEVSLCEEVIELLFLSLILLSCVLFSVSFCFAGILYQ